MHFAFCRFFKAVQQDQNSIIANKDTHDDSSRFIVSNSVKDYSFGLVIVIMCMIETLQNAVNWCILLSLEEGVSLSKPP